MPTRSNAATASSSVWYRQPVLWFGILIFAALLAGCVWMIVVSVRHADTPLDTAQTVFGVPAGDLVPAPASSPP